MDQDIGKMLDDRYEILELIGSGGMANVYKARCHRLNRLVAIKILKSDLADNADFRRRFHDESQAVAQLSHANIVSVYDVSTNPDREYIVMELIDGITLKQYMERRGRMDWRESLHFITQIMRGLSHAHSRGIIHRDIKPQNIMVLRDGSVKVADFGIACLANQGQTLTQEALGSVHYISPEQARGDRIDARSDIYSAGVLYSLRITCALGNGFNVSVKEIDIFGLYIDLREKVLFHKRIEAVGVILRQIAVFVEVEGPDIFEAHLAAAILLGHIPICRYRGRSGCKSENRIMLCIDLIAENFSNFLANLCRRVQNNNFHLYSSSFLKIRDRLYHHFINITIVFIKK